MAIGNVGVAARIEKEASTANLPKTFLSRYFYLCMSLVLAALVMSGFSRIVQRQPVPRQPARPVAFVGTRSGLLNVDSLLYRSVGSGARAEGQPLLGWFGAGLLTVMPWRFYWSRPFLVALFIKQAAQDSEASVFSATPSAKRRGDAFFRPPCRGLSSLPS